MINRRALIKAGAVFSKDRQRRLCLWRQWSSAPVLIMVMLNPSKADEGTNDPTIERCQRRALKLGYGGLYVVNVIDFIETDSRKLKQIPLGMLCSPENKQQLAYVLEMALRDEGAVLCAWGAMGQQLGFADWFVAQAEEKAVTLYCLKRNKDGSPGHPLYIPYTKKPVWFAGVKP